MGFFSAAATGFAKQQNADFADQQQQQDQLTRASLSNILKNVDNYNQSKAEYQQKQTKAQAIAAQTGLQTGDVMGMMNMGFDTPQIIQQSLHKQTTPAPSGNVNQQTQTAMPGAGGTTTPATTTTAGTNPSAPGATPQAQPSDPAMGATNADTSIGSSNQGVPPATAQQDQSQPQIPGIRKTAFDTITGNDPSAKVGQNAIGQAGAVTGMSPDELAQARTGHYTPTDLPTTSGFKIDPSAVIDYSKFDPSKYSSHNVGPALEALKHGDYATAIGLQQNADDRLKAEIEVARAKHAMDSSDATTAAQKNFIFQKNMLTMTNNPATGKPFTDAEAMGHLLKIDTGSDLASTMSAMNPNGLTGDEYLNTLPKAQADVIKGYADGKISIPGAMGKGGIANRNQLLAQIMSYDPSFDSASINQNARSKLYTSMTSGDDSKNITSINTAIGHLGRADINFKALHNVNFTPENWAVNSAQGIHSTGKGTPLASFQDDGQAVASELAVAFRGNRSALQELEDWKKSLSPNMTPDAWLGHKNEILQLLDSRIDAIADKYNRGMSKTVDGKTFLTPKARQAYYDISGTPPDPDILGAPDPLARTTSGTAAGTPASQPQTTNNSAMTVPLGQDGKTDKASMQDGGVYQVPGHPPMKWDAQSQQLMDM